MRAIFSVWVRYAALFAARAVGWMYHVLFSTWYRALVTIGTLWALFTVAGEIDRFPLGYRNGIRALGALLAVAVVRWVIRARRRLIIGNFTDYTAKDPTRAPGMSTLLQVEVARLYELIRVVDDTRAVRDAVRGPQNVSFAEDTSLVDAEKDDDLITKEPLDLPAPIRAEDLTNVLDAAVSIEATMSLGPVRIPIGALASILGRLAQGPRLMGSIHCTHDTLVVSAHTVGDKQSRTWRVDKPLVLDADGNPTTRPEDLVDELAVRVLTDLALEGSVKWQATWEYVNGLRAYRECLRTKRDRRLNLEAAKGFLLETIAEDDKFDLAHYNLGVVATELGQLDAAEAAFLAAIERNTARWDPYYGLAQLYFVQERYDEMLPLCGRMIRLRQRRAESYHLRALANRRTRNYEGAVHDRKAAVRWAWLRLCWGALKHEESEVASVAATSLRNLGGIRAYMARGLAGDGGPATPGDHESESGARGRPLRSALAYAAAQWELRQGTFLEPSDAELHFELGKIYASRRRWRPAARHFERAVEIMPDRPRFWVQLARAYVERLSEECGDQEVGEDRPGEDAHALTTARRQRGRAARRHRRRADLWRKALSASMRAYEQPSEMVDNGFKRLAEVYPKLGRPLPASDAAASEKARKEERQKQEEKLDRLLHVRQLAEFEVGRRRWEDEKPDDDELEAQLRGLEGDPLWEDVQVSLELARRYLKRPDQERTRKADVAVRIAGRLLDRMEKLREFHRQEVKRQDVYAVIAKVLHAAGQPGEALPHAELAVRYNPLSYEARTALADVHLALGHLTEAETAWRGALVSEPERPYPIFRLGETLVKTAVECHSRERKRSMLTEAADQFRRALHLLDLHQDRQRTHPGGDDGMLVKGEVAFWLGRALFDLDRYEEAATQLQLAILWDYQPWLARLRLGVAYVRMGHFCEGEREFQQILAKSGTQKARSNRRMVGPPGDELSWREVVVWARIYHAASHIERDAGVKEAITAIEKVTSDVAGFDGDAGRVFLAACADWEGWGWFSLGDVDRAIQRVTDSAEREPTAEAYLHLAQLFAHRALYGPKGAQRRQDQERARHAADLARRMGLGTAQREPLDETLRRLDNEKEPPAAAKARAAKSDAQPVG